MAEKINQIDILNGNSIKVHTKFIVKVSKKNGIIYESKSECKIVEFLYDCKIDNVLKTLKHSFLQEYPNFFILCLKIEKHDNIIRCVKKIHDIFRNRRLILQIRTDNSTKVFYKEGHDIEFYECDLNSEYEKIQDFSSALWYFLQEDIEKLTNVQLTEMTNSTLFIKYMRVFQLPEKFISDLILQCAKSGTKSDFMAVLDIETENEMPSEQIKMFNLMSLISTALLNLNDEIINFLIQACGFLMQKYPIECQIDLSTKAFECKKFDVLCYFLNVLDFPFPRKIRLFLSPFYDFDNEKLKIIIDKRTEFFNAMTADNKSEMSNFIESHPNLKLLFNIDNKSALYQAALLKKYDTFWWLKSKNFCVQISEDIDFLPEIRHLQTVDSDIKSVKKVLERTAFINDVAVKKDITFRETIKDLLEEIYCNQYGVHFIELIATTCSKIKISFDFNKSLVSK